MGYKSRMPRRGTPCVLLLPAFAFLLAGCRSISPPANVAPVDRRLEVTAYCKCGQCCGWRRNWFFRPVYASGPQKGKPKRVGVTSSGRRARVGTISADPAVFPVGTVMYLDGYGYGRVEDTGGAIKGNRIELFFRSHSAALEWGRQRVQVKVWFPPGHRLHHSSMPGLAATPRSK